MNYNIKNLFRIGVIILFLATLLPLFAGCASNTRAVKDADKDTIESDESKLITAISATEDSESSIIWIRGNHLLTYTAVKQPSPLGVVLYFPETALDNINTAYTPDSDYVSSIKASELTAKGHTTRVEILLKKDASYEVSREDTGLKIAFKKTPAISASVEQELEKKEASAQSNVVPAEAILTPATRLESIQATQLENSVIISVNADGTIKNYKSFSMDSPARIVFDIMNIKSPYKTEQLVQVNSKFIKRVRHYGYPDRLRIVLDTKAEYLAAFTTNSVKEGLLIHVGKDTGKPVSFSKVRLLAQASTDEKLELQAKNDKPAWINRIDFISEEAGKSTIIIGTTTPVKYNLEKIDDKKLLLNLFNTRLPDYHQRPLITTRFQSAVDRILPLQKPAMKDASMIVIELREAAPYFIEQTQDLILVHFEASSIPPKPLDAAKLPAWKKVMTQAVAETKTEAQEPKTLEARMPGTETKKEFTGEKIALNFYNTDIKNVLRILIDVSGKNFAIDKDVSGQVTLTFDKPVPWDQVLDLILKMNRLDMTLEGDIIRIATLKTLKAENAHKQAQIAAEKKLREQQKDLEPLITEYIPINYAQASADIKPHIILTKDRGSITVDERNNQVIITDVAEMIQQAKETIRRIDQVTPQVIIEARIVEATTSFSRDLGSRWAITGEQISWLDGNLAFDMGATNPAPSVGEIGIQFSRLGGNVFSLLDARLMASESQGQLKIISAPKILTLDNTPATIKQGTSYPYTSVDAEGNPKTEFKDVNLELQVTPHVTPDSRVAMEILVTNNELGAIINEEQSFTTKEAQTELLVDDGDTVIIGGIRKTRKDSAESGVPGLMKIPLLGWLFKTTSKADDMEELLIFITPRIVQLEQRGMPG